MAIILLTSAAGAPGVTTTALGLTLAWPRSALLVDADYQQAYLTGWMQGRTPDNAQHALVAIARAAMFDPNITDLLWERAIPLSPDDPAQLRRLLLPGIPSAVHADLLRSAWPQLVPALKEVGRADIDTLIDLGRLTPARIPPPLLAAADQICLLLAPTLRGVGQARWAAAALTAQIDDAGISPRAGLIFRPAGLNLPRYSATEISRFLNMPELGQIVDDPAAARWLSDGGTKPPRWDKTSLAASMQILADRIYQQIRRREEVLA